MMKKKLIIGLMGLIGLMSLSAEAQNGFNLPYSQYGLGVGELPFNMPAASRMGGVVYTRQGNNIINPFNPASYGSIETESFVFDMGFNIQLSRLTSGEQQAKDADGNVGYLAIGMPITRWWKLSAGLMPYSTMDFMTVVPATTTGMKTVYEGAGGANEAFVGMAFNLINKKENSLQAGINLNYLTGKVQKLLSYVATDTTSHTVNSRKAQELRLGNAFLDFGVQYRHMLNEKYTLGVGLTFKPHMSVKVKENTIAYTYQASSEAILDTIFPARGEDVMQKGTLEQPNTLGIGVNLERNGLWQVAADMTFGGWQGLRHTEAEGRDIFGQSLLHDGSYSSYALGFEKMVNMNAQNYIGRLGVSVGAHMEQGLMYMTTANGERRVDQWGVGAGFTLPMRKGRSLLTLSVGYSSMGDKDIMQRECVTFGIAVSSCERWFVKRKYN